MSEKKKNHKIDLGKKGGEHFRKGGRRHEDKVPLLLALCGDPRESSTCPGKGKAYPPRAALSLRGRLSDSVCPQAHWLL